MHVRDPGAAAAAKRFGLEWTPTILVLDENAVERHRIEGFLPPKEFAAQLVLGLGNAARHGQDWKEAERRYEEVVAEFGDTEAAPEALYWRGVVRYKAGDAGALPATAEEFTRRYASSNWAKKSSVWLKQKAG